MNPLGLYVPGTSPLHRAPAGLKLVLLLVAGVGSVLLRSPWQVLVALGIRCVPVVIGLAEEVRDAQRARGLGASPRAFAVPLLVRSLRHADALGEALTARGADD